MAEARAEIVGFVMTVIIWISIFMSSADCILVLRRMSSIDETPISKRLVLIPISASGIAKVSAMTERIVASVAFVGPCL